MRHLVSCSSGVAKPPRGTSLQISPVTRPRRTGRDPSVLLTVVGDTIPVNSDVQNPNLNTKEEDRKRHLVSCSSGVVKPPKGKPKSLQINDDSPMKNYHPQLEKLDSPMKNYDLPIENYISPMESYVPPIENYIPPMENYVSPIENYAPPMENYSPPTENYVLNEMKNKTSSIPDKILDGGWPVTLSRLHGSTSLVPGQSVGWLSSDQLRRVATSGQYWHKFIVHRGAGYSKLELMYALFEAVHPQTIAPVMFHREGTNVSFLARLCIVALLKLHCLQNKINVKCLGSGDQQVTHTLDIEIILRHTYVNNLHLNIHNHLTACVTRRHDKALHLLDLSAFHDDPELSEVVFWALWIPKALSEVLNLHWSQVTTIRWLSLRDNGLVKLPRMDMLSSLEVIDLSSNKIAEITVLMALQGLNILDITLDNNPVCALYPDEPSYILAVRGILPAIKKLDGVHLIRPELPVWRRNYVPPGQAECITLVDQFLQHYFSLLDGDDRQKLQGMYHPDALFSLTCNYTPGQSTSSTARLTRYTLENRNLLRLSDYSKSQQLLSQGTEEVLATLQRLPRTEHDPYSFNVDMPYYNDDTAIIVVNGVFREPSMMNENLIRAFSRTFVLRKVASREYQIINEMLNVSNSSSKQAEESFAYPKPKVSLAKLSFNPAQDLTDADQKQMIKILSRLTEMKQQWARKCLQQTKWDIKLALVVFTELLQTNKLPGDAFEPEEDKTAENK